MHVCSNETIGGVQFKDFPEHATLVADMSPDILSRPVNVDQFALIYAGAQNIGPADSRWLWFVKIWRYGPQHYPHVFRLRCAGGSRLHVQYTPPIHGIWQGWYFSG